MRGLLLAAIRGYWRLVPAQRRRRCLFAQTCSRHVYCKTERGGFLSGSVALWRRFHACRPGYVLLDTRDINGERLLQLNDGSVIRLDLMSVRVKAQLRNGQSE